MAYRNSYQGYMELVTILILIDGFLQSKVKLQTEVVKRCHNPYFNRWFSAIDDVEQLREVLEASQSLF